MMRKSRSDKLQKGKHLQRLRTPSGPREAAELTAVKGLAFLGEDPARLAAFLGRTGLRPDTLRTAAREPHFLGQVLEFIREDERLARDFCQANELDGRTLAAAQEILTGPGWERDVP